MLAFLKHRLVLLAMPKCGSTALEAAFGPHADVVINGFPRAKHTPFRKYNRYLAKYLESFTDGPLEVACLFRDPVDWLGSWWRYRSRDRLVGTANSTRDLSFDDFVGLYLDGGAGPAKVGRQAQFVSDKDGQIGVDHIWRYENLAKFSDWLAGRLGVEVDLKHLNASPPSDELVLSQVVRERIACDLSREFEIYRDLAR